MQDCPDPDLTYTIVAWDLRIGKGHSREEGAEGNDEGVGRC
jgi:hypothetical protein